ncbi:long-chain-fatty-acyl-CoA reductase [Streptomyces asoensis]|uniref:Acyl-CoA reductase n=1 Tax=Streptomyces asoensis TaxID=249586 RepID=A0A6M4WF42_9ACTN|nr:acyl-CoA reductase [Streptomyces asoensis]QJS99306.1 long-chain-fatty-acyl-CoA reductase [Streptomyces asoensis]
MSDTTLDGVAGTAAGSVAVVHIVRGEVDHGAQTTHGRPGAAFTAPALDLDRLVWPRSEPGPAFQVPVAEIVDLLVETGEALRADRAGLLAEALERMVRVSPLPAQVLERAYAVLWRSFRRPNLYAQIDHELGGTDVLDGWREVGLPDDRTAAVRAFPPRLVHIIAGNAPGVAAMSVVRGALTKGVNLLKLPSNDLFTATAILRTMAAVAPGHPVVRSFSAVYWRGGDETVESVLFRPQFFDKLVAWGGEATIRGALRYVGPGFELVSFDPKTSISLIGREAFESPETLARAAEAGAADATFFNQQACVASRFQFVEGSRDDADRYAALLCERLGVAREFSSADGPRVAAGLREEIDVLRSLAPEYRVWGGYDGRGLVIRSPEPVDFHPDGKIVDVVPVADLSEAVGHAGVATQTVGVYPPTRKAELRDALACAGVQRVVSLGGAGGMPPGLSHDGFYPLQRLMRWVNDE